MDRLDGKRTLLLTGVTGFLGQVVLERLLLDFPDTRIVLLVRGQTGATPRDRVEYLLRKPAFTVLRERYDEDALKGLLDERIDVVDGDFGRGEPEIPAGIDVAIHSAAAVSFDPPIDEGFQTNLLGAINLYRGVLAGGSRPAFVHVSTAYVAGVQKGVIPRARSSTRWTTASRPSSRSAPGATSRPPAAAPSSSSRSWRRRRRSTRAPAPAPSPTTPSSAARTG